MNKHIAKDHKGEDDPVKFEWKVLGVFKKPHLRQISQAYHIDRKIDMENFNSKKEFNGKNLKLIRIEKKSASFTCNICGKILDNKENM